jgi:hypothetical protein
MEGDDQENTVQTSTFFSWGVVRLSPFDMFATIWPIVPALDDI